MAPDVGWAQPRSRMGAVVTREEALLRVRLRAERREVIATHLLGHLLAASSKSGDQRAFPLSAGAAVTAADMLIDELDRRQRTEEEQA